MTTPNAQPWRERLLLLAVELVFPELTTHVRQGRRHPAVDALAARLDAALAALDPKQQRPLQMVPRVDEELAARSPPHLKAALLRALGLDPLQRMARAAWPGPDAEAPPLPEPPDEVLASATRADAGHPHASDPEQIRAWIEERLRRRRPPMPDDGNNDASVVPVFKIDPRGLPTDFNQTQFEQEVDKLLTNRGVPAIGIDPAVASLRAYVKGRLLLEQQFDFRTSDFRDAVRRAHERSLDTTLGQDPPGGQPPPQLVNRDTIKKVADQLVKLDDHGTEVHFQELASVSDFVIDNAGETPVDHKDFPTAVRIGLDNYVVTSRVFDTLDLPDLVGNEAAEGEIEPDNVRAVGMIYAAHQLEQLRLFDVVDRLAELFVDGLLPIGLDGGGRLLDKWVWDRDDMPDASARHMQFTRTLGAPGGEVSQDVQPNKEFDNLLLRVFASIAEYDRQRRVAEIVNGNGRPATVTSEYVRQAARDWASNASLYGWAYAHFAARRFGNQIRVAFDILNRPEIQRAYGVTGPFQVIERVASIEFNAAPNIVRHRTMAKAGKDVLDLLAKYAKELTQSGAQRPFLGDEDPRSNGVIRGQEYVNLITSVENWLAVMGVQDEQVDTYSQPAQTAAAPSIPTFGAFVGDGSGNGALEELRQLASQGQPIDPARLQELLTRAGTGS